MLRHFLDPIDLVFLVAYLLRVLAIKCSKVLLIAPVLAPLELTCSSVSDSTSKRVHTSLHVLSRGFYWHRHLVPHVHEVDHEHACLAIVTASRPVA